MAGGESLPGGAGVSELIPALRELQSATEQRMLLCGLISPEHFPHFSQNEQEELVPLVVFNCQFDPLEAGG